MEERADMEPGAQTQGSIMDAMLSALPLQRLRTVTEGLGLPYPREGPRASLMEAIAHSRLATIAAVGNLMRIEELRKACSACGLENKANRTQVLVQRLVAAGARLDGAARED